MGILTADKKRKGDTVMKAKDLKKFALCLLAALILTGGAACGNSDHTEEGRDNTREDAMKDDGIVGDTGEAIKDGVEDLGEDMKDGAEDAGDSIKDNAEKARED